MTKHWRQEWRYTELNPVVQWAFHNLIDHLICVFSTHIFRPPNYWVYAYCMKAALWYHSLFPHTELPKYIPSPSLNTDYLISCWYHAYYSPLEVLHTHKMLFSVSLLVDCPGLWLPLRKFKHWFLSSISTYSVQSTDFNQIGPFDALDCSASYLAHKCTAVYND